MNERKRNHLQSVAQTSRSADRLVRESEAATQELADKAVRAPWVAALPHLAVTQVSKPAGIAGAHGHSKPCRFGNRRHSSFGNLRDEPGISTSFFVSLLVLLVATGPAQGASNSLAPTNVPSAQPEPTPTTPREFFNAGSRKLHEGKLREAEAFLQTALARQDRRIQPPALYNLGHVRFGQGAEELKKSSSAKPSAARGRAATQRGDQAIRQATDALAGNDVQKMVAAYVNGRGARKELKAATTAVRRALELHGAALRKWQRALGDFKSAAELDPADEDARRNAEIVERAIAKLVDSIREMQQAMMGMAPRQQELGEKLKQLRGQIPEPLMPPGAAGDEEEDEDGKGRPPEPELGQKEGPSKEGEEMSISPEAAAWLLEGFKLDGDRRLPMGQGEQGKPQDRGKRNW